jgi:predicted CXXCH cytochrome family protein
LNGGVLGKIAGQPGGSSKLCLSCHDGSIAIASYGYGSSSRIGVGTTTAAGAILIGGGGDLRNHHPIGFEYMDARSNDDEIAAPTATFKNSSIEIQSVLYNTDGTLGTGSMECGSCHSVHNTKNTGKKLLWIEDTDSDLCLSCHLK